MAIAAACGMVMLAKERGSNDVTLANDRTGPPVGAGLVLPFCLRHGLVGGL